MVKDSTTWICERICEVCIATYIQGKKKEKHYNAHMSYLQDFHKENLKGMFIGYNGAHYNTLIQWFTAAY